MSLFGASISTTELITLLALALIVILLISLLTAVRGKSRQGTRPTNAAAPTVVPQVEDEEELVAVLAAAVAACTGSSPDEFRIVSYTQRPRSLWDTAAQNEQVNKWARY